MGSRTDLQTLLEDTLNSENVYFQPPESMKLLYPCIVYKRNDLHIGFANDVPYRHLPRYQITVMDTNPDSEIPMKVASLPTCQFDRKYTVNNLNHDVFNIYY